MKTLLLLGSAVWLCACGSSNSGTPAGGTQVQPTPSSAIQTPQQPTDSVPPANTQQAPNNSQLPALATPPGITCAQLVAAIRSAGCDVSDAQMAACVAGSTFTQPCGAQMTPCISGTAASSHCDTQLQAELSCLMHYAVCNNDTGIVDVRQSCPDQNDALNSCLGGGAVPTPACNAASNCSDCAGDCALCQCAVADQTLCAQLCPVN